MTIDELLINALGSAQMMILKQRAEIDALRTQVAKAQKPPEVLKPEPVKPRR